MYTCNRNNKTVVTIVDLQLVQDAGHVVDVRSSSLSLTVIYIYTYMYMCYSMLYSNDYIVITVLTMITYIVMNI